MSVVNRASVPAPTLPKEAVTVEALGGDVVVRGMLLTQRLALQARMRHLRASAPEGTDPAIAIVPELLAQAVVDDAGEPVFSTAQWELFGAQHQAQALGLFNTAMRLSGFDAEATAKN